jgi:PAS domain S-box-containing protein
MLSLRSIDKNNSNPEFTLEREKHLKSYLLTLTIAGSGVVLLWVLFDFLFYRSNIQVLLMLRFSTIAAYAINLFIAFKRNSSLAYRQHLVAGFYLGTLFCAMLTSLTGYFGSSYTYGFLFIIICWLVLIPLSYKRVLVHFLVLLVLFNLSVAILSKFHFPLGQILQANFLFLGVSVVGIVAAFFNNQAAVENYLIKQNIQKALEQVSDTNRQLKVEMEKRETAVTELREKQVLLHVLLNQLPLIIWSVDFDGNFIFNEGSGLKRIGSESGLRIGQSAFEVYKGNDQLLNFIRKATKAEVNAEIVLLNGIYWDTRVVPYLDQQGKQIGILGVSFDITELVKMQQSLSESEMKHRTLIEKTLDGIVISQDGKVILANQAIANMLGYSLEEMYTVFGTNSIAPEDRERVLDIHNKRMRGEIENMRYTASLLTKTGGRVILDFNSTSITINNKPASLITLRDITEFTQIQNALKESEAKYRTLIEKSLDGIIITQAGKVHLVNQAFANMLGYTIEEMYTLFGPETIASEDRERVVEIHYKRMRGEIQNARYTATMLKKNGERVMVEFNTTTIQISNAPASLITARDVTEISQMQNALMESEAKYRMLIDRANDGIIITQYGKFRFANRAFCELMEYAEEEVIEKPFVNYLVEEDKERLMEYHRKRMAGDTTQFIYECNAITKTGKIVNLELNTTHIEYQGNPATFIIMRDLTDRKAIERELEKSQRRYKSLIESIQEGLYVVQDQKFVFLNEAIVNLIGYSVDELKGNDFIKAIPPEHREIVTLRHKMRMNGEPVSTDFETTLLHKNGTTRVPVILSTTLTEFDGRPAVVGTAKDITERMKAEETIRKAHSKLEEINHTLEQTIEMRTTQLTEANTQLLKLQKENLQSQFEMLKQQVNPHFLFNSLNVLSSLIKLEPNLAERFTEHLSKVYRYVLENKDFELVKLSTELEFLDAYIFLLSIRFEDKLQVKISIPDKKRDLMVIPLALQLLIENAIKHNAMSQKSPLIISIFIDSENNLVVKNNLQEREKFIPSTGVGLKNITHRYMLLNLNEPQFERTDSEFIASVPLINKQNYESINS